MSYRLERSTPVDDQVRRLAADEIDTAISDLDTAIDDESTIPTAIHDCRKRCKKTRGLLRLFRPALGRHYGPANTHVREAARAVSSLRDADALLTTYRALRGRVDSSDIAAFEAFERRLEADAVAARAAEHSNDAMRHARRILHDTRQSVDDWALDAQGWGALGPGIEHTYQRAKKAMRSAIDEPTAEHFHEWRKHAKYGWYHLRLLQDVAPSILQPLVEAFSELGDALGHAHDIAVLADRLDSANDDIDHGVHRSTVERLLSDARVADERRALAVGAPLYVEPAAAYRERLAGYWELWQRADDQRRVDTADDRR